VRLLSQIDIRKDKFLEVLAALKVDKSPDPDELCPRPLWVAREEIAGALTQIFNFSLSTGEVMMWRCRRWTGVNTVRVYTGEVPEDWRTANEVPLFKKGYRNKPGNYRPVSLTSASEGEHLSLLGEARLDQG